MKERKVLLIEDDKHMSETIRQMFISLNYSNAQLTTCYTLSDAMLQLPGEFSVVITSLSLPDSQAAKTFKTIQHYFSYLPVIVLCSMADEELAIETICSGAQDYLIKTDFDKRSLQKAISNAIERKKNINDYERLFDESPVPMYIYEPDTFRFLAVNEACLHQYGYSTHEFLNMSVEDIRPPEDLPAFRQLNVNIPEQYHDFGRWRHIRKNDEYFFVQIYAHGTIFNGRNARLVTAINVDNIMRVEQELQEKSKEINNILESINDGFFTLNKDGVFVYVNKECEKIFGYKRQELLGKNIRTVYDKDEYATFYEYYELSVKQVANTRFEAHLASADKWLSVAVYPTKNGLAVYLVDVTERRKIRQQLRHDEKQLRAVINNTSDMVWLMDTEQNIIIANDAFRRRIKEAYTDAQHSAALPEAMATNWQPYFNKAFSGDALTFTWQETIKNKVFYDEISLYPIRNEDDAVTSVSCFSRNVTKQQLRLQKIQHQNEYLEKIAWMHSHEARAPVANILGLTSLLETSEPDDPDNKMMLELIVESANQLDKTIRKITASIDHYQLHYGDDNLE